MVEVDRGSDPGAARGLDVRAEGDVEPACRSAAGLDVVAFDPVVDHVGADPEHGCDFADGALVVGLGVGAVRLVEVIRRRRSRIESNVCA